MKVAIYIVDGTTQLVLTPTNPWEEAVCKQVGKGEQQVNITRGAFYECRGGWYRESGDDNSLIIRCDVKPENNSLGQPEIP